jgi:hypothetical protein
VNIAEGVSLRPTGTFVNAAGGTIAATGTGRLWAFESTFKQGAGTTSGSPVVVEQSSLQYTGSGASHIVARGDYEGYGSELRGNLAAGPSQTVEGSCNAYGVGGSYWGPNAILEASSSFTNAGTITLTSASGGGGPTCTYGTEARLNVPSKATLTNTGTIDAEAGLGGQRILQGEIENEGTVALQPGVTLQENGSYSQGKSGRLKTAIGGTSDFGALSVNGTATLAGTLELAQVNGFRALDGQRFAIVTAGSRAGGFEFVKGAAITSSLSYSPLYSPTGVTLEAIEGSSEPVPTETSPPVVSGAARQGQSLVLTHGAWTHSPFEYEDQWLCPLGRRRRPHAARRGGGVRPCRGKRPGGVGRDGGRRIQPAARGGRGSRVGRGRRRGDAGRLWQQPVGGNRLLPLGVRRRRNGRRRR